MRSEEWKQIAAFTDYAVSNLGRVKRLTGGSSKAVPGRILKPCKHPDGHVAVHLCRGPRRRPVRRPIHSLVAQAFIGPAQAGKEINHIDGSRSNNLLSNLEYITHTENIRHAWKLGLYRREAFGKLKSCEVYEVRRLAKLLSGQGRIGRRAAIASQEFIGKMFRVRGTMVSRILHGKRWKEGAD